MVTRRYSYPVDCPFQRILQAKNFVGHLGTWEGKAKFVTNDIHGEGKVIPIKKRSARWFNFCIYIFAVSAYLETLSKVVEGVSSNPEKDHEMVRSDLVRIPGCS